MEFEAPLTPDGDGLKFCIHGRPAVQRRERQRTIPPDRALTAEVSSAALSIPWAYPGAMLPISMLTVFR